jgi:hypothetical protein
MTTEQRSETQSERRAYFRIDDTIKISFRIIEPTDSDPEHAEFEPGEDGFTIMTRLQAIDRQISAALRRIEQRNPDVADYLKALDEKINLIAQSFLVEESTLTEQPSRAVNLSAGGLALDNPVSLEVGTKVQLKLMLLPSYTGVVAIGKVVGVEQSAEDPDYPYRLHINFVHIPENGRDALIRHILRRQGAMLRQQREQQDQDT